MANLSTSVILCTRNRINDIVRCLHSIAKQTELPDEIIIVDSGDHKLLAQKEFTPVFNNEIFATTKLVYLHTKPGLTFQRNIGIKNATGDIIYFFDDDTILDHDYLHHMNNVFHKNQQYAGGMGDIINVKKSSWQYKIFRTIFMLPREGASGNFTWSGMPTHPYSTKRFKVVEVLGGCCMAFRACILKDYKFDENLYGYSYMEDCDIAKRIAKHYQLFFNPSARLQHLESPTNRDVIEKNSEMFVYNYSYLFFKNFYSQNRLRLIAYIWSIIGLFIESLLCTDFNKIRGYKKGIKSFYEMLYDKKLDIR